MLVKESRDFDRLNYLLNHPAIHQWVSGGYGELDAKEYPGPSIILEAEHGMFWFIDKGDGVWEAHTQFLPSSPNTFECALEAIQHMRSLPGYTKITTQGPRDNPRALRFLEKLGFTYTHTEGFFNGIPLDHYEKI